MISTHVLNNLLQLRSTSTLQPELSLVHKMKTFSRKNLMRKKWNYNAALFRLHSFTSLQFKPLTIVYKSLIQTLVIVSAKQLLQVLHFEVTISSDTYIIICSAYETD